MASGYHFWTRIHAAKRCRRCGLIKRGHAYYRDDVRLAQRPACEGRTHRFLLNITPDSIGSTIEMDGKKLENVRTITVHAEAGKVASVTVEFVAVAADITAEAELIEICQRAAKPQ